MQLYFSRQKKQIKIINKFNFNKFKCELSQYDWSLVTSSYNPNQGYEILERQFQTIYNDRFPTKTIKLRKKIYSQSFNNWRSR